MSAAEIADSINWNKIKNVNTLVKIGEIYEKAERYQDARDILLMAYDRSPIGRMIIYRLAEVAIKMGDYDAATEYYDEFVEIAPHDDMKYVLRYAIKKGQGASFDELITILEEYKDEEYTEEWAYELAYLYHKAGKADKCIDACDELILWFGDGPYVERALELKMLYQPLTKAQEAGDIMERLNDVIPKLDAGVTPKELLEEEYLKVPVDIIEQKAVVKEPEEEQKPDMQELYAEETVDEVQEPQEAPEDTIDEAQEPQEAPEEAIEEAIEEVQESREVPEEAADEAREPVGEPEDIIMAEESEKDEILMQPTTMMPEITDDMLNVDDDTSDDETSQEKENVSEKRDFDHVTSFIEQEIAKMTAKNPGLEKKLDMAKTRKMPDISLPEDLDSEEDDSKLKETKHIKELTSEQKAIFSYFIPVKGMEDQICKAYNAVLDHFNRKENASTGNLIIQGEQGCGKTMLATSFIKVLQKDGEQLTGKMGKIDAAALNKKDVQQVVRKITGGCLIIERAGDIDRSIAAQLSFLMEHDITGTLYILEDTSKGIKKALSMDEGFASKFTEKISVPIFTNDELVLFAKSYSAELGYKIDEMAILALHNRISNIERIDQATTLTEVKDIIDEAIDREAHSGLKKAISILTARRYTDDDRIVLKEDHFREK